MKNQGDENGNEHGFLEYYNNGQLDYKCEYKNGKPHGLFKQYYWSSVKLWSQGEYKNNKKRGLWYEARHTN